MENEDDVAEEEEHGKEMMIGLRKNSIEGVEKVSDKFYNWWWWWWWCFNRTDSQHNERVPDSRSQYPTLN